MDRTEGVDAVDHQAAEKMEARIHWSISGEDRADYPPDGVETSQPPNIGWHQSRLATLASQPSELVSTGVIRLSSESVLYEPVMHELGDL